MFSIISLILNWTLSQKKASLFNRDHASVKLPCVLQMNVGQSVIKKKIILSNITAFEPGTS